MVQNESSYGPLTNSENGIPWKIRVYFNHFYLLNELISNKEQARPTGFQQVCLGMPKIWQDNCQYHLTGLISECDFLFLERPKQKQQAWPVKLE